MRYLIMVPAIMAAIAGPAGSAQPIGRRHVTPSLAAETLRPLPGRTIRIALQMVPEPGWHGYWSNPGDSGVATSVQWKAPPGFAFGPLQHPAPVILQAGGLVSYVHDSRYSLVATMRVPAGIARGTRLPVTAEISWLACSESLCVPERATLGLNLVAGSGEADAAGRALVSKAIAALPTPLARTGTFSRRGGALAIRIPIAADPAGARFFPIEDGLFAASAPQQVRRAGDWLTFTIPSQPRLPSRFSGVVRAGGRAFAVRLVAAGARPAVARAIPKRSLKLH
jgi:DsbC/DsbD-like thiol-disulfide interchange protein